MELLGKSREELQAYCKGLGEPAYRGGQIYHALYAERKFNVASFTNLPAALREKLRQEAAVSLPVVRQKYESSDGSVRYLFGLSAAERSVGGDTKNSRNEACGGGSGVHAERRAADDLHIDASRLRGGLPVLPDSKVGVDPEFDGGRNARAGVVAVGGDREEKRAPGKWKTLRARAGVRLLRREPMWC